MRELRRGPRARAPKSEYRPMIPMRRPVYVEPPRCGISGNSTSHAASDVQGLHGADHILRRCASLGLRSLDAILRRRSHLSAIGTDGR